MHKNINKINTDLKHFLIDYYLIIEKRYELNKLKLNNAKFSLDQNVKHLIEALK